MLTIVMLALIALTAHAQMRGRHGHDGMSQRHEAMSMVRHHYVHEHGLDSRYAGMTSPLATTADALERGAHLYQQHCASCHGSTGLGDGEAGAALTPAPANLAWIIHRPIASDAYLFWTIAEGGAPVGSAMPPFKTILAENEIWEIIAHLRQLDVPHR
jgi:mono/diheme cytochrome c family protein